MLIIKQCVESLNTGQIPVIALDQPLYTIAKQIQWTWPDTFGEDFFVIMFGGLHIEMALYKLLGEWLDGSGWTFALTQGKVASSGTADAFLKASHVTKTRRTHQVTAYALYKLLKCAYNAYIAECGDNPLLLFEWCDKLSKERPHFHFWYITLQLEMTSLLFVR